MVRSTVMSILLVLMLSAAALASGGGKITYPDGSPVAGATVVVMKDEKERLKLTTDANGSFTLPHKKFKRCTIRITAPDNTAYAQVSLPVSMFQGHELAVVLQPKQ